MSLVWFKDDLKEIIVTLTPTQITINKQGSNFFEKANKVMLGFDKDKELILIKPLSKDEVMRGDIPETQTYNISMNVSYARITNKSFMNIVNDAFNLDLTKEGKKYKAKWFNRTKVLEVTLREG